MPIGLLRAIRDFYNIARLRIAAVGHIAGKNPRMPASSAVGSFSIHANSGQPAILA